MRHRLPIAGLFAVLAVTLAGFTVTAVRPHRPAFACDGIRDAIERMTGRRPFQATPLFYSDEFGHVAPDERAGFVRSLRSANGHPDRTPARLDGVWPLGARDAKATEALYVVAIVRERWFLEQPGLSGDPDDLAPAGYSFDRSYWVASFIGDTVFEFRETPFAWRLVPGKVTPMACRVD